MTDPKTMSKADQASLRSLIRAKFKVLRRDVVAREAELKEELAQRLDAADAGRAKEWADAMFLIDEAAKEANRKANDVLRALGWPDLDLDGKELSIVGTFPMRRPDGGKKFEAARTGQNRITAQVAKALAELDRQEATILEELTVATLETDAARAFLSKIPTVGELVPADRLLAITGIDPK
jgi:hypothetical protein